MTSIRIVAQMDALFALDAPAPAGALSLEARHELRLQKAPPLELLQNGDGGPGRQRPFINAGRKDSHEIPRTYKLAIKSRLN